MFKILQITVKAPSLLQLLLRRHTGSLVLSGMIFLAVLLLEFVPVYTTYGLIRNFAAQQTDHKVHSKIQVDQCCPVFSGLFVDLDALRYHNRYLCLITIPHNI